MVDKGLEIFIPYRNVWENGKSNQEREPMRSSQQINSVSVPRKRTKNLSSKDFSDEDFIVFSLREDGAIHRNQPDNWTNKHSASPISRKLIYGSNEEIVQNNDHESSLEQRTIDTTNEGQSLTCNKTVKANRTTSVFETRRSIVTKNEKQEEVSASESIDSNRSEGSSGSFAFPVLSWEGRESPAQMPKPETLHFWKHKKWGVLCLCKRF